MYGCSLFFGGSYDLRSLLLPAWPYKGSEIEGGGRKKNRQPPEWRLAREGGGMISDVGLVAFRFFECFVDCDRCIKKCIIELIYNTINNSWSNAAISLI